MRPERQCRGYTLVEVLVAFVILAMTLTVLFRIFSGGVRNIAVSADYARATLIAESRLAAAGIDEELRAGETSGVEADDFAWTRSVTPYLPFPGYASPAKDLRAWNIMVTVEWPHADGRRRIDLSTVRLTLPAGSTR